MKTLGIKKAREVIRLDDSEGSPEYVLDLTDAAVGKHLSQIRRCYKVYEKAQASLKQSKDGQLSPEMGEDLAKAYRKSIEIMLGKEAYEDICAYVGEGLSPSEMNLVLTPLVLYLFEQFNDVVTANDSKAVKKYMKGRDGSGAI